MAVSDDLSHLPMSQSIFSDPVGNREEAIRIREDRWVTVRRILVDHCAPVYIARIPEGEQWGSSINETQEEASPIL